RGKIDEDPRSSRKRDEPVDRRADGQAYVEMSLRPNREFIPIIRRFVSSLYLQLLRNDHVASRMALATHELLENTVKFSTDGESALRIAVARSGSDNEITIRTHNRAAEQDRAQAMQIMKEMRDSTDAFDYYQQVMRRNARRREGSGLGLARICAEAE